ncbi:MAG: hypothetical protein H6981_05475 [Gammaproteobacteria bacterium]|nr:hypothetical protein [Gammaproteobacteria bacterium]MCP5136233.1 hypothetical protein [Gammaproteobacteria bacterium]
MNTADMTLKTGARLNEEDVATIANAFKALAMYEALNCEHQEDDPELRSTVNAGLAAVDRLFN